MAELPDAGAGALLCVERDPEACHRSLIADAARRRIPRSGHASATEAAPQASPALTIASCSNICISVASSSKTARLAAFQLAILSAPYM